MSDDEPRPSRLSLPSIEEFSTLLRTVFINIGFFAATILLIPSVAGQFTRSSIVIDPIAVPDAMIAEGLVPEVVANRLWDGLQDFAATAAANRKSIAAIPESQLIEFSLPDSGISIDSIFAQVRQFFNIYETHIGGEFICDTPGCEPEHRRLRVRVVRQTSDVVDLPEIGTMSEQDYFRSAAAGVYEFIDPYVAIAAQAETAPLKAATLARGLVLDGSKDAKWAHNLVGQIELDRGDAVTAEIEYRAALKLDQKFVEAQVGLVRALFQQGKTAEADAQLADAEKRNPKSPLIPQQRAVFAIVHKDTAEAIRQLLIAAEVDPLNPGHYVSAGRLALEAKQIDDAKHYLREALAIDPGYGAAIDTLAQYESDNGNFPAAVELYKQWLEFEPDNLDARFQLGVVQQKNGDFKESFENLKVAYEYGGDDRARDMMGGNLLMQERYEEAIAFVKSRLEADPTRLLETAITGKSLMGLGRVTEAVALYEHYLSVIPLDDPSRPNIEAGLAKIKKDHGLDGQASSGGGAPN